MDAQYFLRNNFIFKSKRQAWIDDPVWKPGFARKRKFNSYFQLVRPILLMFLVFGRFPFGITVDGVKPFRITSIPAVYTFLFYVASCFLSVKTAISLLEMLKDSQNYDHSLQILMLMAYLVQNFLVPITYWQKSGQLVEYVALWSRFESEYNKEFNRLSCHKWIIYLSIFFLPLGVLYWVRMYIMIGVGVINGLSLFIMIYTSDLLALLWVTTLYEIRKQARKLGEIVSCEGIRKDAQRKRCCWLMISTLTSSLGDTIGLATGCLLVSLFFSFLVSYYGRLTSFMERIKGGQYVWLELLEGSMIYVFFFLMSDSAERATLEVGKKFSSIVLNLKHQKMDKETLDKMSLLLSCVSSCPPIVNFVGFFVVNRTLVTSAISNSVTYLVMLFQYRRK